MQRWYKFLGAMIFSNSFFHFTRQETSLIMSGNINSAEDFSPIIFVFILIGIELWARHVEQNR